MDRSSKQVTPSIYARAAYDMILSGVQQFKSEQEQQIFLDSLLCQCAVFCRMTGGEEAYLCILERLRTFDFEAEEPQDLSLH
ncbi:TPA: hypothetical protein OT834_002902 [Morganella morganii]|nr:hypothetical protein [Morganella morganii]